MNLNRLENLIGTSNVDKLKHLNILIIGLGGVGGYVVESLVRSGVGRFTLVDYDTIKPSNINRQIVVTRFNNNKYKTKEWKKRIKLINKEAKVNIINTKITEDNIELLFIENYDYIIDACDTVLVKISLIKECHKRNVKLISSMGMANKLDASKIQITTLDKTDYDPLAKKIRRAIRDKEIMKNVTVVSSTEKGLNTGMLASNAYVPAVGGLYITNHIINDIMNKKASE